MTLDDYLNDLRSLESSFEKEIEKAVSQKENFILGLVRNRLYQKGVDAFGRKIEPEYTESTVKIKKAKNQRTSHVTLRDTGAFYSSLFLHAKKYSVTIDSTDYKVDLLIEKYGEGILGFTKTEQELIMQSVIEPHIEKIIRGLNNKKIDL